MGVFSGEGQGKILLCNGGGGHNLKNKNIGACVLSTQPNQQKRPQCKNAQKCKQLSNIEKYFLARFAHSAFYKIHISGAANRHVPVQYAKYVFFCCFFLSSHHNTNPLLHLYHFRKKNNYILANINSESSKVIFSFFYLHPKGQTFLYPSKFVTTRITVLNNIKNIYIQLMFWFVKTVH